jgi:radical SAM protein with 4Fe4S-binding SPASM domain
VTSGPDFKEKRMTIDETRSVMKKFFDVGMMEWRFTGGEPTSCEDFLEALAYAKSLGMAVMVNTNGCWDEAMSQSLISSGVDELIISLEGKEEINDRRRAPGVFKKVVAAIGRIQKHNEENPDHEIRVTINMTIARDNVCDLEFVVRFAARHGCNVNFVPLRPFGRTLTDLQGKMLSTREFMEFSKAVQALREDPEIISSGIRIIHRNMDLFCPNYPDKTGIPYPFDYSECGALSTGFGLCPDGRVNACSFLMNVSEFLGPSMLEVSATEAWLHPSMNHFRAQKVGCGKCRFYRNQCEGKCRAMVLANNGSIKDGRLLGFDPYCFAALMPKQK